MASKETCRLEVLLKDYELIRAEAIYRLGSRERITAFFVPVVGALVAAAYKASDPTKYLVLAFAVPFVCFETIYLWMSETQALRRASRYLFQLSGLIEGEVAVHDGRTEPRVLAWERELRTSVPEGNRSRYYLRHFALNTLLFWVPAIVFAAIGCNAISRAGTCLSKSVLVLECAAFLVAIILFIRKTVQIVALYRETDLPNPDTV